MTLDKSMEHYSINVLELLAIWMATLKGQRGNIIMRIMTDNSTALSAIRKASSRTYHLASISEMIWKRASVMRWNPISSTYQRNFKCNSGSAVPQHRYNNRMVTT